MRSEPVSDEGRCRVEEVIGTGSGWREGALVDGVEGPVGMVGIDADVAWTEASA
jgi:hypothetical protein